MTLVFCHISEAVDLWTRRYHLELLEPPDGGQLDVELPAVLVGVLLEVLGRALLQQLHLGETVPLSQGVQAGRKALSTYIHGVELHLGRAPGGSSEPPEPPTGKIHRVDPKFAS